MEGRIAGEIQFLISSAHFFLSRSPLNVDAGHAETNKDLFDTAARNCLASRLCHHCSPKYTRLAISFEYNRCSVFCVVGRTWPMRWLRHRRIQSFVRRHVCNIYLHNFKSAVAFCNKLYFLKAILSSKQFPPTCKAFCILLRRRVVFAVELRGWMDQLMSFSPMVTTSWLFASICMPHALIDIIVRIHSHKQLQACSCMTQLILFYMHQLQKNKIK